MAAAALVRKRPMGRWRDKCGKTAPQRCTEVVRRLPAVLVLRATGPRGQRVSLFYLDDGVFAGDCREVARAPRLLTPPTILKLQFLYLIASAHSLCSQPPRHCRRATPAPPCPPTRFAWEPNLG